MAKNMQEQSLWALAGARGGCGLAGGIATRRNWHWWQPKRSCHSADANPAAVARRTSSPDGRTVTLAWTAPAWMDPWIVERDGIVIAELSPLAMVYADAAGPGGDPAPNRTYHYKVCAKADDYLVCSRPLTVSTARTLLGRTFSIWHGQEV